MGNLKEEIFKWLFAESKVLGAKDWGISDLNFFNKLPFLSGPVWGPKQDAKSLTWKVKSSSERGQFFLTVIPETESWMLVKVFN